MEEYLPEYGQGIPSTSSGSTEKDSEEGGRAAGKAGLRGRCYEATVMSHRKRLSSDEFRVFIPKERGYKHQILSVGLLSSVDLSKRWSSE